MVGSDIPGREIAALLDRAARSTQQQTSGLRGEIDRVNAHMRELVAERADRVEDLVRHYLPDINPQTVRNTFADLQQQVGAIVDRKQQREQTLHNQWDTALDARQQLENELDDLATRLDALATQRADLEAQLAARLKAHAEFQTLSQQALSAEQELNRNEQRVAECRQEAAEKLPAYEKSRMFKYLYQRGYGTAEYKQSGLTRVLDSWVAKLVHYAQNRQSYDFLRVTPELMTAEVQRRRAGFTLLMQQIEKIEDAESDALGLTQVLSEGDTLGRRRSDVISTITEQTRQRESIEHELQQLQQPDNEYHRQAVAKLRDYFGSLHEQALAQRARQTSDPVDDQLAAEIAELGEQMQLAQQNSFDTQQRLDRWHERMAGLDYVVQMFRRHDFDSGRSQFRRQVDYANYIDAYLGGQLSKQDLWQQLVSAQRFVEPQYAGKGWVDISDIIDSDVSHVLLDVLLRTAGEAMRQSARRGMVRRGPVRREQRSSSGRPPIHHGRRGGFTTGGGF